MSESFQNARAIIACTRAAMEDLLIAGFAERLEPRGKPADSGPGSVRCPHDEQGDATATGAGGDERILFGVAT